MFKLTRPCVNCPFRKGIGERFQLQADRLEEIFNATAFQCHCTVIYDDVDGNGRSGEKPQQCAGLMSLLYRAGRSNQIMQVGQRLRAFDPGKLDHSEVYETIEDAMTAHRGEP